MNSPSGNRSRSPVDQFIYRTHTSSTDNSEAEEATRSPIARRTRFGRFRRNSNYDGSLTVVTQQLIRNRQGISVHADLNTEFSVEGSSSNTPLSFKFDTSGKQSSSASGSIPTTDEDCAICRDQKVNPSYIMPCMHTYCFNCILQWVRINPICPLCKAMVQKIIHSIKSDTDYREYDVRSMASSSSSSSSRQRSVINFMTPILNFISTVSTQSTDNVVSVSGIDTPSSGIFASSCSAIIMTVVMRALRGTDVFGPLLRRLVYANRLFTFPSIFRETSDEFSRRVILRQKRRTIDFIQRELLIIAPWLHFIDDNDSTVALRPLSGRNAAPIALCQLAVRIESLIVNYQGQGEREADFAIAIKELDSRSNNGAGLLQTLSMSTLKHFAWEILQFAHFRGTIDEYYSRSSFYVERDPTNNVERNCPPRTGRLICVYPSEFRNDVNVGFGTYLTSVSRQTTHWLYRHLLDVPRSPYLSLTDEAAGNIISYACQRIYCAAAHDPASLITSSDSYTNLRRQGVRALLVRMVERLWPSHIIQMGLCELIDLARIDSATVRCLSRHGQNQVLHRFANLINYFSDPSISASLNTSLLPIGNDGVLTIERQQYGPREENIAPLDLTVTDNSGTEGNEAIIVSDGEDSDPSIELQLSSSSRHSFSSRRTIPPCCIEHRAHCCCCYRRRSANHMPATEFAQMFREFVKFYERRRRFRRRNPSVQRMLNRPSSPIEISDNDSEEEPNVPQPGPSRPREIETETPTSSGAGDEQAAEGTNSASGEEEQQGHDNSSPPTIDCPTTAKEFYFLLNQALIPDKRDEGNSSEQQGPHSSLSQPVIKEEELQEPARPTSAP